MVMLSPAVSASCLLVSSPEIASVFADIDDELAAIAAEFAAMSALTFVSS